MSSNFAEKIKFFKQVVNDIQFGIKNYHLMNVINSNEYNICLDGLEKIINLINSISNENIINELQYINNNLSSLIKNYGIYNFENFIKICLSNEFGDKYLKGVNLNNKLDVLYKYLHPLNYKILNWTDKGNRNLKKIVTKEISKNTPWDPTAITPGTTFMEKLNLKIYSYFHKKYTSNNLIKSLIFIAPLHCSFKNTFILNF